MSGNQNLRQRSALCCGALTVLLFGLLPCNSTGAQTCGELITYPGGQGTWSDSCVWGLALSCYPTNGNCSNAGTCTIPPSMPSIEDHWRVVVPSTGTPGIHYLLLDTSVVVCELQFFGGTIWALYGPENLTVESEMLWTGGWFWGEGTTTSLGDLTIVGPVGIASRAFVNSGDAVLSGDLDLYVTGYVPTSFTNASGATLEVAGDATVLGSYAPTFQNDGLFKKTGSGLGEFRILFNSTGTIQVEEGTLRLTDLGGTLGGSTVVFPGATLELNGGGGTEYVFAGGSSLTGGGTVVNTGYLYSEAFWNVGHTIISAGTVDFAIPATTFAADISGGTITGDLHIDGPFTWTGGILGSGEAWVVGGTVDGGGLYGRTLHNLSPGSLVVQGIGMSALMGATIENEVGATFQLLGDVFVPFGQSASLVNEGTFLKTGPDTHSFGPSLINHGLVEITGGTLSLASFEQVAGVTDLAGGVLYSGAPVVIDGGRLTGTGLVNAPVTSNGSIEPAGMQAAGIIEITGTLILGPASELRLELGGLISGVDCDYISEPPYLVTLDGFLRPSFINGFESSVTAADEFVVLESLNPLGGAFTNVASGDDVLTTDGLGVFTCYYGPTSPYPAGQVVLTNFRSAECTPGWLYYTSLTGDVVRYDLAGSVASWSVATPGSARGIALDIRQKAVYVADPPEILRWRHLHLAIQFGPWELVVDTPPQPEDLALTPSYLFWTDSMAGEVRRSALDGSSETTLNSDLSGLAAIAAYHPGQQIYWTDPGSQRIRRSDHDGLVVEDVLTAADGLAEARGIAIDADQQHLYFTEVGGTSSRIRRCDLDGANLTDLVEDVGDALGIVFDLDGQHIYWVDQAGGMIWCVDLDGGNRRVVVDGLLEPHRLALDTRTADCNGNGIADSCDIAAKTSRDVNSNGIPDECESGSFTSSLGLLPQSRISSSRP